MSYNGTGTFVINTAGQPVVTGTIISATAFNLLTGDLATGLSTAMTKDGQTTATNNIPMGTYRITGLGAGTAATDAVRLSQIQGNTTSYLTASGTDVITATGSPTVTAYTTGAMFTFIVANTNTSSVTLNVDSLGAKAVTRDGATALIAGDLLATETVIVIYDGTRFQVVNANAAIFRDGTSTITANLPMATYRHTGVGNAAARTDYAATGQVQDYAFSTGTVGGSANAVTLTPSPAITAYVEGQLWTFEAASTNTGATTLNVSTVGAIAAQKTGAALVAGDITSGDMVTGVVRNVSGTFTFQMISPARTPVLTSGAVALAAFATGTQGDVLYYGASGAAALLAAGTSGYVLSTQGASANPQWIASSAASAATQAEMEAASSTSVYASPGRTVYHPGVAKVWCEWTSTGAITASQNVSSVTDNGTGDWTVNFTTAFSSATYAAVLGFEQTVVGSFNGCLQIRLGGQAAGTLRLQGANIAGGVIQDLQRMHIACFGDI